MKPSTKSRAALATDQKHTVIILSLVSSQTSHGKTLTGKSCSRDKSCRSICSWHADYVILAVKFWNKYSTEKNLRFIWRCRQELLFLTWRPPYLKRNTLIAMVTVEQELHFLSGVPTGLPDFLKFSRFWAHIFTFYSTFFIKGNLFRLKKFCFRCLIISLTEICIAFPELLLFGHPYPQRQFTRQRRGYTALVFFSRWRPKSVWTAARWENFRFGSDLISDSWLGRCNT